MAGVSETFDYGDPFFVARLVVGSERTIFPLWMSDAQQSRYDTQAREAHLNGLKALSFVTEVSVQMNLGYVPRIRVTLSPPYEDAIKFLDSDLVEYTQNHLEVQFGYAKGAKSDNGDSVILSPFFGGITHEPEISFGSDITITLTAQGIAGGMGSATLPAGTTFTGTLREALELLAKRSNWVMDFKEADADAAVREKLDKPANQTQGWMTDLMVMRLIANSANCTLKFTQPSATGQGTIQLIPRNTFYAEEEPAHTLALYHFPSGRIGGSTYPILNASCPTKAIWLPGVRKVLMQEIDLDSKNTVKKFYGHEDIKDGLSDTVNADMKGGSATDYPDPDEKTSVGAHYMPGDPADSKATDLAIAAYSNYKEGGMGVNLDIDTIGIPTLEPGMVVAVRGLGMRLDRPKYGVHEVTHTLNSGGYLTRLHMIANSAPYLKSTVGLQPEGPVNKNEPSSDSGSDTSDTNSVTAYPGSGLPPR